MRIIISTIAGIVLAASFASAQRSPASVATGNIGGKSMTIKYGAPYVKGRQIFGDGGLVSNEPNYPVWRAGADPATVFHTDGDLQIGGVAVPKGDYSFYVFVKDPNAWELIINKQTGQWGLDYDKAQDLGRIKMTMSKPPALIEQLKYVIESDGATKGKILIEWENHIASVPVVVK